MLSRSTFRAMGSSINVWLDGHGTLYHVPYQIEAYEACLSRFRPNSELNQLNQQVGEWVLVSSVLQDNLIAAHEAAQATDGLVTPLVLNALIMAGYDRDFDDLPTSYQSLAPIHLHHWQQIEIINNHVWLPDQIDLGGTAKGWVAQTLAQELGVALVDIGGDIFANGKSWAIHITDPFNPSKSFATVAIENQAIATSGTDYHRWGKNRHHIIDPRTTLPAETDVLSATVIYPDAVLAEAFAKAVLLQGSHDGLAWLNNQEDAAGLVFRHDGSVLATSNFQAYFIQGDLSHVQ